MKRLCVKGRERESVRGNGSLVMTLDPNDPTGGFEILDGKLY